MACRVCTARRWRGAAQASMVCIFDLCTAQHQAASSATSSRWMPTNTNMPLPISPTTSSSTVTLARLTRCSTSRIARALVAARSSRSRGRASVSSALLWSGPCSCFQWSRACCETQPSEPAQPVRRENCPAKLRQAKDDSRASSAPSSENCCAWRCPFCARQLGELQSLTQANSCNPDHVSNGIQQRSEKSRGKLWKLFAERLSRLTSAQRGRRS